MSKVFQMQPNFNEKNIILPWSLCQGDIGIVVLIMVLLFLQFAMCVILQAKSLSHVWEVHLIRENDDDEA